MAREVLRIRRKQPDEAALVGLLAPLTHVPLAQNKLAEAEPLLLAGYKGMKQREAKIPAVGKPNLKETLRRLVQLYDATGCPDRAAEWKQKLAEFEKTETEKLPGEPPR